MNMRPLCFLLPLFCVATLQAAISPVPVVTLDKVNLPKVTLRISNPDKTSECRIWAFGNSWEEQNKWFSLRAAAGGGIVELHPNIRSYTVNFPRTQSIPAGGSVTFQYDLSDSSREGWNLPDEFKPGSWNFQVQARFDIPREIFAHRHGVFIGMVTSPWYDAKGGEVEAAGKPAPDPNEIALEKRTDFPWERLTTALKKWKTATMTEYNSLDDFFGKDFPWDHVQARYHSTGGARGAGFLEILLPDQGALTIQFRMQRAPLAKLFARKEKAGRDEPLVWLDIKTLLPLTRAEQLQHIRLVRGSPSSPAVFARAFDAEGRLDKGTTESLSR